MEFERQPDPEPPDTFDYGAPSLFLYIGLLVLAGLMVAAAFIGGTPDWPGLLINLATELFGAVIILIIVERRLRQSEVRTIQSYTDTAAVRMYSIFSRDISSRVSYARNLGQQLHLIRPDYYVERADYEDLIHRHPEGFLLVGERGLGKTVILQDIAEKQTTKVLSHPKQEALPLFYVAHRWFGDDLLDWMYEETSYYGKVQRRTYDQWLESGRVIVIFDGIDETSEPEALINEIRLFQEDYPKTAIILSFCTSCYEQMQDNFAKLGLPVVQITGLTDKETEQLLRSWNAKQASITNV